MPVNDKTPFFFTWTAQKDALRMPIKAVQDFSYILQNGKKIEELSSVSFQASFGLRNQRIENEIKSACNMPVLPPKAVTPVKTNATNNLLDYLDLGEGRIFYTVSGAEAVENALKISRQIKKRNKVLARRKSYHGATLGALSVTGDWRNPPHSTIDEWTVRIPEPDEDPDFSQSRAIIEKNDPKTISACIIELVSGANGVCIPGNYWIEGLTRACKDYDIHLIVDEVVTGFHRTGTPLACHHWNLRPDMICLSKGITGGMVPFGALWTNDGIVDYYENNVLSCGLTSYAHSLGLSAMQGVLDCLSNEAKTDVMNANIKCFHARLDEFNSLDRVSSVRKIGLLAAVDLTSPLPIQELWNYGLSCFSNDRGLVLAPFFHQPTDSLDENLNKLESVLKGSK